MITKIQSFLKWSGYTSMSNCRPFKVTAIKTQVCGSYHKHWVESTIKKCKKQKFVNLAKPGTYVKYTIYRYHHGKFEVAAIKTQIRNKLKHPYYMDTKQSQSYNFKEIGKNYNFEIQKNLNTWHSFWSCLIICAIMKWMWLVLWKIQSGHDFVHRRMNRWTDKVKPVYPPPPPPPLQLCWKGGYNYYLLHWCIYTSSGLSVLTVETYIVLYPTCKSVLKVALPKTESISIFYCLLQLNMNNSFTSLYNTSHLSTTYIIIFIWCKASLYSPSD